MACAPEISKSETFVPVCANVILEAPGVIYVSIDPDVWKIRCRQCQEKTEHKCALKKLKNRFRGDPSKRREPKPVAVVGKKINEQEEEDPFEKLRRLKMLEELKELLPPEPIPDDICICPDRPPNQPFKPNVCLCAIYKPLNFMMEVEISGEFKPVHVPKTKKDK